MIYWRARLWWCDWVGVTVLMLENLRRRPWVGFRPPTDLSAPFGMVGPKERACYYWHARHFAEGRGAIVDAGSVLGASTFAFADGAEDGGLRTGGAGPGTAGR